MIDEIIKSALRAIDPLKETALMWEEVDMIEVHVRPDLTDPGAELYHEVYIRIAETYYRYSDGGYDLKKPTLEKWKRLETA